MLNKKYPVGIQDLETIRKNGHIYIDKTMYIEQLLTFGKYFFLSRPRRFGKSLLINTIENVFKGKKELFEGLYIADKRDWTKTSPIISISFNAISHKEKGLFKAIHDRLDEIIREYGIEIQEESISAKFQKLIKQLAQKHGDVVVLIDEYDKPIIDYLGTDTEKALENRDIMKSFYSILKDADPYLKLVFITGISKFASGRRSAVSIFSDLNNLYDLSIDNKFAGVCGITQEELETNFAEELQIYDKQRIKEWYNGYTWDLKTMVYNPFSLLTFFTNGQFQNYWFVSGTPTFLINLSKKAYLYNFEEQETTLTHLNSYDIEKLQLIPLMYQTGYLTFKDYDEWGDIYTLGFPNKEVKKSYLEILLDDYMDYQDNGSRGVVLVNELRKSLLKKDLGRLQGLINGLYQSLPYTLWQKENEAFYHAILHIAFTLLGVFIQSEVLTSDGRIDALVQVENYIYCFEFKLDIPASDALRQIKEKGYLTPFLHHGKECIAIGVNFSREEKKVAEILWETLV